MTIHGLGSQIAGLIAGQTPGDGARVAHDPIGHEEAGGTVGAAPDSYVAGGGTPINDPNEYTKQFVDITVNDGQRAYSGSLIEDIASVFGGNDDFTAAFAKDFDEWFSKEASRNTLQENGIEAPDFFDIRFVRGKLDYEACVYVARALQHYMVAHRPEIVRQALEALFDPTLAVEPAVEAIAVLARLWTDAQSQGEVGGALTTLKDSQQGTLQAKMLERKDVQNFIGAVLQEDAKASTPVIDPFTEDAEQNLASGTYLPPDRATYNQAYNAYRSEVRRQELLAVQLAGRTEGEAEGEKKAAAAKGPVSGELETKQGYQAGYVFGFSGKGSGMWSAAPWAKLGGTVGFSAEQGKSAYERTADYPFEVPTGGEVNLVPQLSVNAGLWSDALAISAGVIPDLTESGSGLGVAVSGSWKPGDGPVTVSGGASVIKPVKWGANLETTDAAVSTQMGAKGVFGAAGREKGKEWFTGSANYLTYNDGKTVHIVPVSVAVRPLAALGISGGWTGIFFPGDVFKQKITGSVGWDFTDSFTLNLNILYASKTSPVSFDDPLGEPLRINKIDTGIKTWVGAAWKVSDNFSLGAETGFCSSHLGEEGLHTATANGVCGAATAKVTF